MDPAQQLAAELADLRRRVAAMERATQLPNSSVEIDGESVDLAESITSAGAKTTSYHLASDAPPEGPFTVGDLWFITDQDNRLQRWDGDTWEPFGLGDSAFSNIDAGSVQTGTLDAESVTVQAGSAFPRVEFAALGIKAYDAAGVNTVTIGSDGKASFTGAITGSTITGSMVRAAGTGDTSLASTGHALQAGPTAGQNLAIDGNEAQARNNGAAANLILNGEGGNVSLGALGGPSATHYAQQRFEVHDADNRDTLYIATDYDGGYSASAIRIIMAEEAGLDSFNVLSAVTAANNTPNTVYRMRGDGNAYADAAWNGGGADFAELFESLDGTELPLGRAVTLVNGKVRVAAPGEDVLGVTSATPTIVGNNPLNWPSMWERDPYGRPLVDANGRRVLSPDYDPSLGDFEPRSERPEWSAIGLIGQIVVDDDGTGVPGGRLTVAATGGTFTAGDTGYLVIARVDATHARVLVLP